MTKTEIKPDKKVCIRRPIKWDDNEKVTGWEYKRVWRSEFPGKYSTHDDWTYTSKTAYKKAIPKLKPSKTYTIDPKVIEYEKTKEQLYRAKIHLYRKLIFVEKWSREWYETLDEIKKATCRIKGSVKLRKDYPLIRITELPAHRDYKHNSSPESTKHNEPKIFRKNNHREMKLKRRYYVYLNKGKPIRKRPKSATSSSARRAYRNNLNWNNYWNNVDST